LTISVINVARNSLKFTSANLLGAALMLVANIYVATILLPGEYGVYGFLGLWLMYANLIRPGFTIAGYREIPVLLGQEKDEAAQRVQNVAVTADMFYSVLPFIVIIAAAFCFADTTLRIGLLLTALGFALATLTKYYADINLLRQNFNVVAWGRLITAVVPFVVIMAAVHWLKVYALIIAPIVMAAVLFVYYRRRGPIHFRFTFDRPEVLRLVKVGIVLQAGALVLWAFRLADRTVIASMLPLEQLGLYAFAIGFIMAILKIPTDFTNVLQPILYKGLGKAADIYEGFRDTRRVAVYLALGTAMLIPLSQLGFYLVVTLIADNYIASLPIFYVLSYDLYLAAIMVIAVIILTSSVVNKQNLSLLIHGVGLGLNIALDILVVRLGYGVVGVAWVTIGTQGLVTLALYYAARRYMFAAAGGFRRFLALILLPFAVTIPFYFLHEWLPTAVPGAWRLTGISLAAQAALWGAVIAVFYRKYVSRTEIRLLVTEIKKQIRERPLA